MSPGAGARAALLCALLLPAAGCVSASWRTVRVDLPPEEGALAALEPGVSTLAECLDALGAPNEVLEDEQGDGWVLTWSWSRGRGWGASASVPLSDSVNASLNWDDDETSVHRVQLRFSPDGTLRELADDAR